MANYPDWVMKYKKKGTYINHANGKYYLYAAHSERIKGTKKVKRICDGYLGRITEDEGLIPPKDKVSGNVEVFEYGRSKTILLLCKDIYTGFKRTFKQNADFVMVASILSYLYGQYDNSLLNQSFLSILFPDIDLSKKATLKQQTSINRGFLMIADILSRSFKEHLDYSLLHLGTVYKIRINGKLYISKESNAVKQIKIDYNIHWED